MGTEPHPHSARLDAIEARFAIADLVHLYARAIRRDLPEDAAALFTEDGWFEIRDGHPSRFGHTVRARLEGRQGVLDYLLPNKGKPHPVPLIHNLLIEITGESATASSLMEAQVLGSGHEVLGEYQDRFRREDGQWRFASRTYTIFSAAITAG
jgi:SnoaL-like domain